MSHHAVPGKVRRDSVQEAIEKITGVRLATAKNPDDRERVIDEPGDDGERG